MLAGIIATMLSLLGIAHAGILHPLPVPLVPMPHSMPGPMMPTHIEPMLLLMSSMGGMAGSPGGYMGKYGSMAHFQQPMFGMAAMGTSMGPMSGGYGMGSMSGGYGMGPISGGYGMGPISGGYGMGSMSGGYGMGPISGGYGMYGGGGGQGMGYYGKPPGMHGYGGGQETVYSTPGMYGMSMHNFYPQLGGYQYSQMSGHQYPKMGGYQYTQYNYDPTWNARMQGHYGGQSWGGSTMSGTGWSGQSFSGQGVVTPPIVNTGVPTNTGGGGSEVVWSWNEPSIDLGANGLGLQSH